MNLINKNLLSESTLRSRDLMKRSNDYLIIAIVTRTARQGE